MTAPETAPIVTPAAAGSLHTNPFPGGERDDDIDNFKPDLIDRGDETDPDKLAEAVAAKAEEDKVAATKAAADKAAEDKAAEEKAAAEKEAAKTDDEKAAEAEAADEKAIADKAAADKAEADKLAAKSPRIPKERFDQVNDKRKAAEARIAELEAKLKAKEAPAQAEADADQAAIDVKEKDYMDAVLDGRHEDALRTRKEIRAAEVKIARQEAEVAATVAAKNTVTIADIEARTTTVVQDFQSRFAEFEDGNEVFNEDLVSEVLALQRGYIEAGHTGDIALKKAAEVVAKINGLTDRKAGDTTAVDKAAADKAAADKAAADKAAADKVAADLKVRGLGKKIEAANGQPPAMKAGEGASARDGSVDVTQMSDEDFAALPESKKRQLRGD